MREILFRGKRIDNGKWVYGGYAEWGRVQHVIIEKGRYGENCSYEVDAATVGQYTGLSDKNSKKIFEGDIVEGVAYSFNRRGVIVWIDKIAGFGVRYWQQSIPTAWENSSILKQMTYGRKDEFAAAVIGNIHDNPELLEALANDKR